MPSFRTENTDSRRHGTVEPRILRVDMHRRWATNGSTSLSRDKSSRKFGARVPVLACARTDRATFARPLGRGFLLALALLGLAVGSGQAQEEVRNAAPAKSRSLFNARAQKAAAGALKWLEERQNKDGSWNARVGFKINDGYRPQPAAQPRDGKPHLGVTALAGMAFLSGGHLPGQGRYGKVVSKALSFVLDKVTSNGYITFNDTRMYSHAFCVLFLAEIYGMTGHRDLRAKLDRAIEFTYKSQNEKGGWRYAPAARDSDMSITVCQVVALRAARNIGIKVPKETIERALKYVIESAVDRGPDRGAFLYQHKDVPFNRNSFPLTAAGLTTVYQAGLYTNRDVERFAAKHNLKKWPRIDWCLQYMKRNYEPIWLEYHDHYFYYYGNYYAAQAMFTRGGEEWRAWYSRVRDNLLSIARTRPARDGVRTHWSSHHVGDAFATATAAIILQVPTSYLPIFQR